MNSNLPFNPKEQNILIVDGSPENRKALSRILKTQGFRVTLSKDDDAALRCARKAPPDLVLLNTLMPRADVTEICHRLKAIDARAQIPVILMGAVDNAGMQTCAADYLASPFSTDKVLACVNTHLALRATQVQLTKYKLLLQREIAQRHHLKAHLQSKHDLLEERAAELAATNIRLQDEIHERQRTEEHLQHLFESNLIGIIFWEIDGTISKANKKFCELSGYSQEELYSGKVYWTTITPPEHLPTSQHAIEALKHTGENQLYEKEYIRKDGTRIPVLIGIVASDESNEGGVAFVLDLTGRKQVEERMRYMADHDELTGLPNRNLFRDRIKQAIAHAHREQTQVATLFIDLDYFKHINDSLGHQVGDSLLKMVAVRLQNCIREGDTVARLGGDEFVLLIPSLANGPADAALVAQKALEALELPFVIDERALHVGGSIGISVYPDDGTDVSALMRAADTAMYHAKGEGRGNYQFFTPALNRAAQRRLILTNSLRDAFARNEFVLHYQPQVDLESGAILSAEALLRWRQPGKGAVSCQEFINIAEETGLILSIGDWVLREACRQLKNWHDLGHRAMLMAVNLSPRQFHQADFQERIKDIIDDAGVSPASMDLEITESALMQRNDDNIATLKHLSDMGIQLSIDDFGTGYSSLAYLQRFPIDTLKIDRSFIRGIGQDSNDMALVTAIISMAQSLNLKVLAEGVETPEQIRFLLARGCRVAQGYYYGEAVSAEMFTAMLRKQQAQMLGA